MGIILNCLTIIPSIAENVSTQRITNRNDPLVQTLEKRYDLYIESAQKGDVKTYKTIVDKEIRTAIEERSKRNHLPENSAKGLESIIEYDISSGRGCLENWL